MEYTDTFSITFGDQAENHVGMQIIGKMSESGFTVDKLKEIENTFDNCKIIDLSLALPEEIKEKLIKEKRQTEFDASVLIIKNGVNLLCGESTADKLYEEQKELPHDKKAKMRGKVVNKHARWNLCYDEKGQEPDYENGKGTVIAFDKVPILNKLRAEIIKQFGVEDLTAELNYYFNIDKCGIGFHGDTERKIVICARLGATIPMHFQWFHRFKPVGERVAFDLDHGDIYVMSERAVGTNWKRSSIATLRHAAGCAKYTTIKSKKKTKK